MRQCGEVQGTIRQRQPLMHRSQLLSGLVLSLLVVGALSRSANAEPATVAAAADLRFALAEVAGTSSRKPGRW